MSRVEIRSIRYRVEVYRKMKGETGMAAIQRQETRILHTFLRRKSSLTLILSPQKFEYVYIRKT